MITFPAIAGTGDGVASQARADLARYAAYMMRDDDHGCTEIEQRYGLYGLAPQQVSEELAEIAASQEPQL